MKIETILEVKHKIKCGQVLFRRPLIEKLMAEVEAITSEKEIDLTPQEVVRVEYIRPNITPKMKTDAEKSARTLIEKYGIESVNLIIGSLAVENMRLVAEINEHRAARGIDPLPVFEV